VADGRQELVLGAVGFFGGLLGFQQLLVGQGLGGDILGHDDCPLHALAVGQGDGRFADEAGAGAGAGGRPNADDGIEHCFPRQSAEGGHALVIDRLTAGRVVDR
jgi:hypothetical protein